MFPYGWAGIVIIASAEWVLFQRNSFISIYCTPVMWTGYILLADNIVYRRLGDSILIRNRWRVLLIALVSVLSWLIFEGYNVLLRNWHYINLPDNRFLRYSGYFWSFATITPGILVTADILRAYDVFGTARIRPLKLSKKSLWIIIILSAGGSLYPLLFPNNYLFPLVWVSFIFLIDPIVYLMDGKSLIQELMNGNPQTPYRLLLAGFICGILWEFWNYWAGTKWVYTVPYFPEYKLFEMPIAGFLGFPPFAIECYVLYQLFKELLKKVNIFVFY